MSNEGQAAPRVSVVLPTYNRSRTLRRAIASVLAQTHRGFELIVVDDGSTDDTAAVLASLHDPRIRVLRQDNNGAASARNAGMRAANAPLIAFLDSDDEWLPTKLEIQLELLDRSPAEVGWIGGAHIAYGEGHALWYACEGLGDAATTQRTLLGYAPWVTSLWLVRREALLRAGLFDERLPCLEDWDLLIRLTETCLFRAVAQVVLIRYGQADSLYGQVDRRREALAAVLLRHQTRWQQTPRDYARWCAALGRLYAHVGDVAASRRWLSAAFRADPRRLRAAGLYLATALPVSLLRQLSWSRLAPALS